MQVKLTFFWKFGRQFFIKKSLDVVLLSFQKWPFLSKSILEVNIDFQCKYDPWNRFLTWGQSQIYYRTPPSCSDHGIAAPSGGIFFRYVLGPFRPSSIAFEMPDRWAIFPASALPRPDLSRNDVSLTPFYLLSARLDQDDVAYAEAKLPQTNILPAGPVDREFFGGGGCAEGTMYI